MAALRASAVSEGDVYLVNGTKTWTTMAQYADWIFCLVRTDASGRKQEGISFLLVDTETMHGKSVAWAAPLTAQKHGYWTIKVESFP